jgi:hypothetical protein
MCSVAYAVVGASVLLAPSSGVPNAVLMSEKTTTPSVNSLVAQVSGLETISGAFGSIKSPTVAEPEWLKQQNAAEAAAAAAAQQAVNSISKVVTYDISTKGFITASVAEFRSQANATLNDARGWARMGVRFQEVASGGMFTLVLSEASQVTSFSSGCGNEYSCRVGRYVVINQDRWNGATTSWNEAGGSLRDYRHMVINHETGHWLGHDHEQCSVPGQPAQVMQQQSISLQGCTFNPWPTKSELWSTQLGIKKA